MNKIYTPLEKSAIITFTLLGAFIAYNLIHASVGLITIYINSL